MLGRRELVVIHPVLRQAKSVLSRRRNAFPVGHGAIREAEEAVAYATVTALVDLLTGEFTHDQLRELVGRLDSALQSP